jgi:polyprenyl-phospho-N-acetylgalactosaminyl synthase
MGKKITDRVAIVIPAYNEAYQIKSVVTSVSKSLRKRGFEYAIIVVDDGSKDDTANQAQLGGAIVIRHILNSGAGSATATGLSYAEQNGFSYAATMDADGQHHPDDVVNGFDELHQREVDLLIGSRLIDSSGMSRVKVLGNKGLSLITYLLFGINSTDSQSGLRIFSRNSLEKLRWKTSGYEFCSEMLWRAKQIGLKIDEYPIRAIYTEYSVSKGQNNWNAINIIKSLLKRRISELLG